MAGFESRYRYVATLWDGVAEAVAAGRGLDEIQASFDLAGRFPELVGSPGFMPQWHRVSVRSLWCEIAGATSALDADAGSEAESLAEDIDENKVKNLNPDGSFQ